MLGIMILPTIIAVDWRCVPGSDELLRNAIAMGTYGIATIFTVMVPAAKSGVLAGIIIGIQPRHRRDHGDYRCPGNQPRRPAHAQGIRTMTANLVLEMATPPACAVSTYCDWRCTVRIRYCSSIWHSRFSKKRSREAVSAAKPAVRAQAKTEKVRRRDHGCAQVWCTARMLTFAVLFLIGYILVTGIPASQAVAVQWNYTSGERLDDCHLTAV